MAFLSNYLRKLTFPQGSQGIQGTTNSTQGLQGIQGVQGTVGIAGTTLLTNTQSGTYTLQRSDIGEVVSGASIIGISSNTFNPGESIVVLNNNLQSTIIDVTGVASTVSLFQEGVGTALTVSKKIKNKSFLNILCTRANQFILGGTLFDANIEAIGGTIIDSAGFRIHVFTSPGPFNVTYVQPTYNTVEYVVVGGGGGSQAATPLYSGGGGAGGFRTGTNFPVTVQNYTITVGLGSTAGITTAGNSIFSTITSTGGGRGNNGAGSNGGSGGGGGTVAPRAGGTGNTPPTTPPQGNNGEVGLVPGIPTSNRSGGGGGAGGGGSTINGGVGVAVTWVPASYGTPGPAPGRYFAGGGAGRSAGSPTGTGGSGGGGAYGSPGTTNTGGGGGGNNTTGGSGIVIIRYPIT